MSEKADQKTETYQLDELSKKEEEANEDTPLKPRDNDVEAGAQTGGGTDISETKDNEKAVMASADMDKTDEKESNTMLDQHKIKVILAIVGAVLLVLLLLIVTIIVVIYRDGWEEDQTYRFIRLVPKPNGPQNLIQFRHGHMPFEGRVWPDLVKQLDELVSNYNPELALRTRNVTECMPGERRPPNTACFFDLRTVGPECTKGDFGYATGTPCIVIQFNNISDWKPEMFTQEESNLLPDLPNGLRALKTRMVYLECKGNSIIDQENMGPIEYTPTQGFAEHYFPYDGHRDYMPPIVAVRFKQPVQSIGIGITCRLWAKNLLNQTDTEPSAILPFNLFIE